LQAKPAVLSVVKQGMPLRGPVSLHAGLDLFLLP
jgi:hypothetical protein